MKTGTNFKTLGMLALTSLSLAAGTAHADGRFCMNLAFPHVQYAPHHGWHEHDGGHHRSDRIDERQDRQRERIEQGLRSGQLTPHEAHRLMSEQRQIERLQHRYLADGHLSGNERQRLDQELDEAKHHIRQERRDQQRRY